MILNEALAEFVGAFIGVGCMSQFLKKGRTKKSTTLLFTGGWDKDSDYYITIIKPISEKHFQTSVRVYHRLDDNSVRCFVNGSKVIDFLHSLGYTFGKKSTTVFIPSTIYADTDLSIACLRGIFNMDGSIYQRYSKRYRNHPKHYNHYKVIQFTSNSKQLLLQIKQILEKLSIPSNKIIPDKDSFNLRITNQQDIELFLTTVKMNHQYHIQRIRNISGS